ARRDPVRPEPAHSPRGLRSGPSGADRVRARAARDPHTRSRDLGRPAVVVLERLVRAEVPDVALGIASRIPACAVIGVVWLARDLGSGRARAFRVRVRIVDDDIDAAAAVRGTEHHEPVAGTELRVANRAAVAAVDGVPVEAEGVDEEIDGATGV